MSCAVATHAAGEAVNPWPPDPEQTARARAANRWPDLTPELLAVFEEDPR